MSSKRRMSPDERALLETLLRLAPQGVKYLSALDDLLVSSLDDGGMGSFTMYPPNVNADRRFGTELVMAQFNDTDGVPVSVTVNLDNYGNLYEVDMWKTDNTPLIVWPSPSVLHVIHNPSAGRGPQ